MAKKEHKAKQVLERTYNIPLRREFLKVARYMRAKKAGIAVRQFLERHMKGKAKLGNHLNKKIWEHGIKNPPHHVKVTAIKYDDNVIRAELVGFPVEPLKEEKEAKKEKKTQKEEKKEDRKEDKKDKTDERKEEVKEEKKGERKEEKEEQEKFVEAKVAEETAKKEEEKEPEKQKPKLSKKEKVKEE